MAILSGLGAGVSDSCRDPLHPWWMPGFVHTDYECKCFQTEGRPADKQCIESPHFKVGTPPYDYKQNPDVPTYTDVVLETPGYVVGAAANLVGKAAGGAAKGLYDTVDWGGLAILGLVTAVSVYVVTR